jgi:two-component system NtrC family sensor kinase
MNPMDFLRNIFNLKRALNIFATDRYKSLKIRIVLLEACLSLVPLFIVATISYFWFAQILKDDFQNQLKWEIKNTKQSIEFFIDERLSLLRFITSAYTYEELTDHKKLTSIFSKFQKEFVGIVDVGVIDSNGIQQAYAGPYHLEGADYSDQNWFNEIIMRSSYVSDMFTGYRKMPHFAIVVKKERPAKDTFWFLRVTIDMETLRKYASAINLRDKDDAFIINKEGVLQTPSRFYGNVLEKYEELSFFSEEEIEVSEIFRDGKDCGMCGYANIKDSPWVLIAIIKSTPYAKIPNIFRNELFYITMISIFFSIGVTIFLSQIVVNRIKKADKAREDVIAEVEHASRMASIGRLAAGVAHEINNPLAIINEKAGLMKDILERSGNLEKNKDRFLILLNGIFNSVNRSRTITHRLLGFSRRVDIAPDNIDINDTIKDVISFIEKEILFRNIHMELNLQEHLPPLRTDKGQIQQVFLNIMNNALDAVEQGGLVKISSFLKEERTIRILIEDNGLGIPKEKLQYIFEPFYTTKEKEKGTGLGLSISYRIMQRLGGTILVESEEGKGTSFIVEIPVLGDSI